MRQPLTPSLLGHDTGFGCSTDGMERREVGTKPGNVRAPDDPVSQAGPYSLVP